jgi:fluoroacetyl-CoA thioesterase
VSLRPGLTGRAALVVGEADTAVAMRSGDVPVLATPRLVALCEEAACAALAGNLDAGHTTVGSSVQFNHLAPTAVGGKVTAEATLEKVEGRRLGFTVSASDANGLVGAGRVTRVVVEAERFLKRVKE